MVGDNRQYGTVRQVVQKYGPVTGIGEKVVRRKLKDGSIPSFSAGYKNRRLIYFADFERWLQSTRVRATPHAHARVDEILAREASARGA